MALNLKSHQALVVENDTKNWSLEFADDLTGCAVTLHIKYADETVVVPCVAVDEGAGSYVTALSAGNFKFAGEASPAGPFCYELQIVYPSGEVETRNRVEKEDGSKGELLELYVDQEIS